MVMKTIGALLKTGLENILMVVVAIPRAAVVVTVVMSVTVTSTIGKSIAKNTSRHDSCRSRCGID